MEALQIGMEPMTLPEFWKDSSPFGGTPKQLAVSMIGRDRLQPWTLPAPWHAFNAVMNLLLRELQNPILFTGRPLAGSGWSIICGRDSLCVEGNRFETL